MYINTHTHIHTVSSLTFGKRVKSIELGGAKRVVENSEYEKIQRENNAELAALRECIHVFMYVCVYVRVFMYIICEYVCFCS